MPALRLRSTLLASVAVLLSVAACSSDSSDTPPDAGTDATPTVTCEDDPRVDTYVANLTKTSADGAVKVTLVASDPAPPERGTNAWTVKVTDAAGQPLANPNLTVTPFMPDHGHGTNIKPKIEAKPDGTFSIGPLYLFMPGVWRVTIATGASGDASAGESVEFFFCVAG